MDIGAWLRNLGLGQYEQAFRDNDIDIGLLTSLTADELKEIGVAALGHRRRLLDAIVALRPEARPAPAQSASVSRRQLTVMFVDLVDSTALSSRLDLEDLREVIGAYHARVTAVVGRFGGFVAKYMGDGVLAYFGYPRAQEDDAEQAIRAGLELVTTMRELTAPDGSALRLRIGIATGLVVVGDLLGSGAAQEQAVVGETPNLAARLQALAGPDCVVVAAATRRLVGELFEYADLGFVQAKGFPEPVAAYRILSARAAGSRFEALHAALTPLVGREAEVALLRRHWRQVVEGKGQVVLLSGEPGIGKSRMLAALQEDLSGQPQTCQRYFCSPHRQDSALHPVTAQLEHDAGFGREDLPDERLAKLERLLAPTSPEADDVTLLAELLSIPASQRRPLALTPQQKRGKTFEALLRRLDGLANPGPLLVIFEDVHWIDPSSRELLDLTVGRVARLPILLLITFRPEFEPAWTGQPHVATLALNRLARDEGASLVGRVAGSGRLSDALVGQILERTDGVPLYIEELTKAILETGEGDTAVLAGASPAAVPATLHASLMTRLDHLGPAAREVAQVGAVIGREFSHELLAAVAGRDGVELAAALEQLTEAGLVFRQGAVPEAGYQFKHALVRDAAYGTLLRDRRRRIHADIVRALEERFPAQAEAAPELIAHHLTEAAETERALGYWLRAGRRSAERSADREAVRHLRRGLEALKALPASAERDRLELEFQLAIGTPLITLSGFSGPEVAAAYERADTLCERLGDTERLSTILFGLCSNRIVRGETRMAQRLAERCRAVAERRHRPADQILAHRASGAALMQLGHLREARVAFERIVQLYDPQRDRLLAARAVTDPRASGLSFLSLVLWIMGYPAQAEHTSGEAFRCAAELGHANTIGHILCHAGAELAQFLRDVPKTRSHAEAAIALAAEHHMPMWRGYGTVLEGWVTVQEGSAAEGIARIRQGIEELSALGAVFHRSHQLAILAEIHVRLGDPAAGLRVIEDARDEVRRTEVHLCEAELHRIEGELRSLAGAPDSEVDACFSEALALAQRQEARSFELRAAMSMARFRRDRQRYPEARDILAPVYAWFTEGFDTPDLQDAKTLLEALA